MVALRIVQELTKMVMFILLWGTPHLWHGFIPVRFIYFCILFP